MGRMCLYQDTGVNIWAGCIYVRIGVCGYGRSVSRSGYGCECMGWLYLGQDRSMRIWAGCILFRIGVC
jgi:hypothetical protein